MKQNYDSSHLVQVNKSKHVHQFKRHARWFATLIISCVVSSLSPQGASWAQSVTVDDLYYFREDLLQSHFFPFRLRAYLAEHGSMKLVWTRPSPIGSFPS